MDPDRLREEGDWLTELRRILRQGPAAGRDHGDRPAAEHRSTKSAVKTLMDNLRAGVRAGRGPDTSFEDVQRVVFNAVDLLVADKVTESETGKSRLAALLKFRDEVERQFGRESRERAPLDVAWKDQINEAVLALRKEAMSGAIAACTIPDDCDDDAALTAALREQGSALGETMAQFVALTPEGRCQHYGEIYTSIKSIVADATRADRDPRCDILQAVAGLRAGLQATVVDPFADSPDRITDEKLVLQKLGSVLDKIENEERLRVAVAGREAFEDWDTSQLWRLFIDGNRQGDGPHADFAFDDPVPARGRAGEIGFMAGCMASFREMLDHVDEPLSVEMLENLHRAALGPVRDDADPPSHDIPSIGGPLPTGISSAFSTGFPIRLADLGDGDTGAGNFTLEGITELLARIKAEIQGFPAEERGRRPPSFDVYTSTNRRAFDLATGDPVALGEDEHYAKVLNRSTQAMRQAKATSILEAFHERMAGIPGDGDERARQEAKLRAIIRCVQDIEVLHAFTDGNCRTMTCVLNKLLLQNGFKPVILLNPNRLDGLSEDQLLAAITDGWRRFEQYRN